MTKLPAFYSLYYILAICVCFVALSSCKSSYPNIITKKSEYEKRGGSTSYPDFNENDYPSSKSAQKTEKYSKDPLNIDKSDSKELAIASDDINQVIENAKSYEGTRYKYGGTTRKGIDCSGLIYTSYQEAGISVPRTSNGLYENSVGIRLSQVIEGDLLFFGTGRKRSKVNHVGLVVAIGDDSVSFIHASTSSGVMISSLAEEYWQQHFISAGRLE